MSRATDPISPSTTSPEPKLDGHVCPFCGLVREVNDEFDPATPCPRCTLADTPTTRNATKARIGPWHVRQVRNPWAPGMRFDTLLALIKRGQVNRDSIVRGPTSHQLWKRAAEIKGLSREFGLCYSCGREIDTQTNLCPHCNRLQEPPVNPDLLFDTRDNAAAAPTPQPIAPPPAAKPKLPQRPPTPVIESEIFHEVPEPARIEMSPPPAIMSVDPTEMLAVTEDPDAIEMARQITARPPARQRTNLRPRQPGADDALLTPQELAAAFSLDFSPAGADNGRGGAAAAESAPPQKRGVWKYLLLLIILGATVLMYLRPDLRADAKGWGERTMASIQSAFNSNPKPRLLPPTTQPSDLLTAPLSGLDEEPATKPIRTPIVIEPPAPAPTRPVAVADPPKAIFIPPPAPKVEVPTTASETLPASAPAAPVTSSPVTTQADKSEPVVEITKPAPSFTDAASAYDESKRLWIKAIDAEANQDYVEAVSCYEKIMKLPADVHPAGLQINIDRARKLAK